VEIALKCGKTAFNVLYYFFRSAVFNLLVIIALTAALTTQVNIATKSTIKITKSYFLF
jgi:hypothetical protein